MNANHIPSHAFCATAIREAQNCLGAQAGDLSEELYTEFARTGNRVRYEGVNFRRRRLLNRLALGELCEQKGRFLPDISRLIDCTLSERSWVLPAHSGGKLPEKQETNIDLFSSQTAAALAMISARLPLDDALQKRIWETIDARIFQPFLTYDYWWRDLGANRRAVPSNWTPWCIHGVLECVRAVLPDALEWCDEERLPGMLFAPKLQQENENILETPRKNNADCGTDDRCFSFKGAKSRSMASFLLPARLPQLREIAQSCLASLRNYFEDYPDDGGCDEGAQYWEHSVGHFFECGIWKLFPSSKQTAMYSFLSRVHMTGSYYMNFADCAARFSPNASMIFLMGAAQSSPELAGFGAFLHRTSMAAAPDPTLRDNMDFRAVLNAALAFTAMENCAGEPVHAPQEYFPSLNAGIFRTNHFCIAAKGGHNGENHNHNDCGNVIVYADGLPILIDAGVGAYTKDTFSDRRYTIWTMQSSYHNLPEINGCMQKDGREYHADAAAFSENAFSCECKGAYPREAGLLSFERRAEAGEKFVKLISRFTFEKPGNHLILNYMLSEKPELKGCCAFVNGCLLKLPKGKWSAETMEFGEDEKLSPVWGHCVYRLRGEMEVLGEDFTAVTIIERDAGKNGAQDTKKMPGYTVILEDAAREKICSDNPQGIHDAQTKDQTNSIFYQSLASEEDIYFMKQAMEEAKKAAAAGDVPIGCVIVRGREILSGACNMRNRKASVLAHAETLAIEEAAEKSGDFRLEDCTLYVTLEPCPMCAGAIVQARIPRVVIGAMNPKAGCAGSILNILQTPRFNHQASITAGVCRRECEALLSGFFKELRSKGTFSS